MSGPMIRASGVRVPKTHSPQGPLQKCGAIAQLGERYNGIVEVVGSIPSGSTIFLYLYQYVIELRQVLHSCAFARVGTG